jgi:hypothetical protein
MYFGSV